MTIQDEPWFIAAKIKAKRLEAEAEGARQTTLALGEEQVGLAREIQRLDVRRVDLLNRRHGLRSLPSDDPRISLNDRLLAPVVGELEAMRFAVADCRTRQEAFGIVSATKCQLSQRAKEILQALQGGHLTKAFGG